jgi:uncharacterized iron-regulated membrane protein
MNIRALHRKLSLYTFIPLGIILVSGIVLQLRNQFEWIQPSLIETKADQSPLLAPQALIQKLNLNEKEIEQIIYKPSKNNASVRLKSGEEIQLNAQTGDVLKRAIRRTNLLIDIHQGSILGPFGQYGIYLLTGLGMIILYMTGLNLLLPRRKK